MIKKIHLQRYITSKSGCDAFSRRKKIVTLYCKSLDPSLQRFIAEFDCSYKSKRLAFCVLVVVVCTCCFVSLFFFIYLFFLFLFFFVPVPCFFVLFVCFFFVFCFSFLTSVIRYVFII